MNFFSERGRKKMKDDENFKMIGRKNCSNPPLHVMILPFPCWYPKAPVPTLPSPLSRPHDPIPMLPSAILSCMSWCYPSLQLCPHTPILTPQSQLSCPHNSSPHYHPRTPIPMLPSSHYSPNPPIWRCHLNETIILFTYSFLLKLEERKKWWDEFQHDRKTSEQKNFKIHINKKENITWIQKNSSQ